MKYFISCIILTLLPYACRVINSPKEEKYNLIANSITFETANRLEKKYNLEFVGFGGAMMHCIEIMSMELKIYRPLTRDEARKLVMECVNEYLSAINANEKVRKYLKTYPFMPENVELSIYSYLEDGSDNVFDPYIGVASFVNGKFYFKTVDKSKQYKGYKAVYTETYQEALRLIEQNRKFFNPEISRDI